MSSTAAPILEAAQVTQRFGALVVLDRVDFTVREAEAVGIVGTNGAGKTTLLNLMAGSLRPTSGTIRFRGHDVTSADAARRCRLGVARAHQVPRPFGGMTVLENVHVGAAWGAALRPPAARQRSAEVVEVCGLADVANRRAATLGLLDRKRLELARSLATGPTLLLLDEIGAGLTDAEAAELVTTIGGVRQSGVSIVWIEHIVHVLLEIVDRLVCLEGGRVIADGPPAAVMRDESVIDSYIGRGLG